MRINCMPPWHLWGKKYGGNSKWLLISYFYADFNDWKPNRISRLSVKIIKTWHGHRYIYATNNRI